jgi:hypothetical protein
LVTKVRIVTTQVAEADPKSRSRFVVLVEENLYEIEAQKPVKNTRQEQWNH